MLDVNSSDATNLHFTFFYAHRLCTIGQYLLAHYMSTFCFGGSLGLGTLFRCPSITPVSLKLLWRDRTVLSFPRLDVMGVSVFEGVEQRHGRQMGGVERHHWQ